MIPMNVLTVRPTLLDHRRQQLRARTTKEQTVECGRGYISPVSVSFNVLMMVVIGRVHRCLET